MTGLAMFIGAGGAYATMIVCAIKQARRDMEKKIVRRNEKRRHF